MLPGRARTGRSPDSAYLTYLYIYRHIMSTPERFRFYRQRRFFHILRKIGSPHQARGIVQIAYRLGEHIGRYVELL